ncbi:MAG: hypothetical protein MJZ41_05395 [Bacteroidaceae bacterium]|nr:hypothetical protein [Bacteroidaceae bacterium]
MTEENKKFQQEYENKSAAQMIAVLAKLILVLFVKILQKGLKIIARFALFIIECLQDGKEHLSAWWHDNNTQEKVTKIKAWIKRSLKNFGRWCIKALKATGRGLKIAAIATWHGIIIGIKATIKGLIHLGPTIKKLWALTQKGAKAFAAWTRRCGRGMKLSHIRRKRAWNKFRQNKGIKGFMVDSSRAISNSIKTFMEEDQEEATADAITDDDIIEESLHGKVDDNNRAKKIGKSIFKSAQEIVEIDD